MIKFEPTGTDCTGKAETTCDLLATAVLGSYIQYTNTTSYIYIRYTYIYIYIVNIIIALSSFVKSGQKESRRPRRCVHRARTLEVNGETKQLMVKRGGANKARWKLNRFLDIRQF